MNLTCLLIFLLLRLDNVVFCKKIEENTRESQESREARYKPYRSKCFDYNIPKTRRPINRCEVNFYPVTSENRVQYSPNIVNICNHFLYIVQIYEKNAFVGLGSIITAINILTAAQCFSQFPHEVDRNVHVLIGSCKQHQGMKYDVKKIHIFPYANPVNLDNDLAIVEIKTYINFTSGIRAIPIASMTSLLKGTGFMPAIVKDRFKLEKLSLDSAACNNLYETIPKIGRLQRFNHTICTKNPVTRSIRHACKYQLGAPLEVNNMLVGVFSWGYLWNGLVCASDLYPGYFTDLRIYENWIQEIVDLTNRVEESFIET